MLQIYRDSLQRVRHHDRLASAQVDAAFTQNQVCRKPKAVQNARANRLDACWDYPPVVGQGHLCVVTATSTTRLCFRQVYGAGPHTWTEPVYSPSQTEEILDMH